MPDPTPAPRTASGGNPVQPAAATTPTPASAASDSAPVPPAPSEDDSTSRVARLFLEDFVVTALLRQGRPLKGTELSAAAEGFALTRAGLRDGLAHSRRVVLADRDWDLKLRLARKGLSREERTRRPLEGTLEDLLHEIGKPLPLPVVVRELANLRGVYADALRDGVRNILRSARLLIETSEGAWLHQSFTLDAGAPSEALIIRENRLDDDPDFVELRDRDLSAGGSTLTERAVALLDTVRRPLSQKVLGFFLWRQDPRAFDARELARALGDRKLFYPLVGGSLTLQSQMPLWRSVVQTWMQDLSGGATSDIDVAALLRQRGTATIEPQPQEIEAIKSLARQANGHPVSIANVLVDTMELEPADPQFAPTLQGLNDALRRHPEFMPVGIGRYLLRESVPSYVGEVPAELRPVHLSVRNPVTDEPMDFEMSDDGLEGDAAAFIHDPQWEDIAEEVEVKLPRRSATDLPTSTRYVLLNHHRRAGTIKLRRMDEDFFWLEGPLTRITVAAQEEVGSRQLAAWASRESGLIYGLGEWYTPLTPASGGVLLFERDDAAPGGGAISVKVGEPDKLMEVAGHRADDLEAMRASSAYLSLFELLQSIMAEHQQGVELPTVWAEMNLIRRTSKRLICSVLSGYHCFYFKQRGPKQILWRYDAGKLDQGFKRNKRKYVRR